MTEVVHSVYSTPFSESMMVTLVYSDVLHSAQLTTQLRTTGRR